MPDLNITREHARDLVASGAMTPGTLVAQGYPAAYAQAFVTQMKAAPLPAETPSAAPPPKPAEIRSWAWRHGHPCPRQGRIPKNIQELYDAAKRDGSKP